MQYRSRLFGLTYIINKNNKLIGIYYGFSKNFDFNFRTLIIYPIIEWGNCDGQVYLQNLNSEKLESSKKIDIIKNDFKFISIFPFTNIDIYIELPKDNDIFEWKDFL